MTEPTFSRPVVFSLVGLGLVSLVFAALTGRMQPSAGTPPSARADSYSTSAVGHAALIELLEELGHGVHRSRRQTAFDTQRGAVLLLLEPHPWQDDGLEQVLGSLTTTAERAVLVLPKWAALPDPDKPRWVSRVRWLDVERIETVLADAGVHARVLRPPTPPAIWYGGADQSQPVLPRPQLLSDEGLRPLVYSDAGILVGLLSRQDHGVHRQVVVVSDPDLLSTHGLALGDNARIAVDALTLLREGDAPLIVDETLHGHGLSGDLLAELLRFPLVLGLVHLGLASLVLLWAGVARFGAPAPAPTRSAGGRQALIENTAQLLVGTGQHAFLLDRYLALTVRRVSAAYHIPAALDEDERRRRLAAIARRRGLSDDPTALAHELHRTELIEAAEAAEGHTPHHPGSASLSGPRPSRQALATARRIHRWHEEMLHGA